MDEKIFLELINQHNNLCEACDISFKNMEESVKTLKKMTHKTNKKVAILTLILGGFIGVTYCKYEELVQKFDIFRTESALKIEELESELLQIRANFEEDLEN